ncbi:hypothetical protein BD779DRAFT_1560937, partial [Infundibulicybe gibba]
MGASLTATSFYGTNFLRVIDASIIPMHPSHHPRGTIYALAGRLADIIKASGASGL